MVGSSEDIKRDIIDQLYWDNRVDASDVTVDVQEGHVTLMGSVPSYLAQQSALDDAWIVEGVVSIDNEIDVDFGETVPNHEDLRTHLENTFRWNPNLTDQAIEVSVDNSLVTLTGSVDAVWKKLRAENICLSVLGVHGVTNEIRVVPTHSVLDETISENVMAALQRNVGVDETAISVKVEHGVVTLSGTVHSWIGRNAAFDAALFTDGVIDVIDNLVIDTQA
jgi:osmotically-inducible protein OsmY